MLTQQQKTALKANIAANTATVINQVPGQQIAVGSPIQINQIVGAYATSDNWFNVANWYNQLASPAYYGWNTAVSVQSIFNATTFANFTPADAPDGTQQWANRSLCCQGKQFNYQIMLQNQQAFDASLPTLRAGLKDCTTNIPSGTGGAIQSAGYSNAILPILSRQASNIEKLFASGSGTDDANASTFTFQGTISYTDIQDAVANG